MQSRRGSGGPDAGGFAQERGAPPQIRPLLHQKRGDGVWEARVCSLKTPKHLYVTMVTAYDKGSWGEDKMVEQRPFTGSWLLNIIHAQKVTAVWPLAHSPKGWDRLLSNQTPDLWLVLSVNEITVQSSFTCFFRLQGSNSRSFLSFL